MAADLLFAADVPEKLAQERRSLAAQNDRLQESLARLSAGRDKEKVYRARLANFSKKEATDACHALKKKHVGCAVVAPSATKVAHNT